MKELKLYINGEFCPSSEEEHYFSHNPANAEKIARFHIPSEEDIQRATQSAEQAMQGPWAQSTADQRATLLERLADRIQDNYDEFVRWEMLDSGSILRKARIDIKSCIKTLKVNAKLVREIDFFAHNTDASTKGLSKNYLQQIPVGVCAQIIPWNFPLKMAIRKLTPALAAGCSVVLKSAEETPVTAYMLAELIHELEFPPGVFNLITGGEAIGKLLLKQPQIKKISFTGSTAVGKEIMHNAAEKIQRLSLELGGKSASIVCADADIEASIDGVLFSFLFHSGQSCSSASRILVSDQIYDQFKEKLIERMKDIVVGIPSSESTGMGPVLNQKQFNQIINFIQQAKNEDATLLHGAKRVTGKDFDDAYYIEPTLFEITKQHTLFKEEVFGPVAGIMSFNSIEEAISLANKSRYGLAAAIWSQDETQAKIIATQLEAGTVWVNDYHLLNDYMPFGGFKESGLGREQGKEGIQAYLEPQHLVISDAKKEERQERYQLLF